MMTVRALCKAALFGALLAACGGDTGDTVGDDKPVAVVRLGHFPNVTHAHGLVAHALSRRGEGIFEKHLGAGVKVEWYVFNAGPSAMESMMAGSLDATYVGPNPALNAYVRTDGAEVRVLGGATNGGSGLVVRKDAGITGAEQLRGKRVATPQHGNTQDVACRAWLIEHGLKVEPTGGGDAHVTPTENPDQLTLFQSGQLDAAWTVEPWLSRLELEAGGQLLVDERDAVTTVFVARAAFADKRTEQAAKLRAAHAELTQWITAHADEAKELVRGELEALTRRPIKKEIVDRSWSRMTFTDTARLEAFQTFLDKARTVGLTSGNPDLGKLLAPAQAASR